MMACRNLPMITSSLIEAGMDPSTPAASIERATQANQRVVAATVGTIAKQVEVAGLKSPMITVVGHVATQVNQDLLQLPEEIASLI